jgi:hypothetical protein
VRSAFLGVIVAVALLAAIYIVPRLFPTPAYQAQEALSKATEAMRTTRWYDPQLPQIGAEVEPAALKSADLQALADKHAETFAKMNEELSAAVRSRKTRDEKLGMPSIDYPAPASTGPGLTGAVSQFEALLKTNEDLLERAGARARQALQEGPNTPGVAQIAGMVDYLKASRLLGAADLRQQELRRLQSEALAVAADYKTAAGQAEQYRTLDPAAIVEDLRKSIAELTAMQTQAAERVNQLTREVAEREQALLRVRTELDAARQALAAHEQQSFRPGDDAGFSAYRERFEQIAAKLRELQSQEQELATGGLRGAELEGLNLNEAALAGGEPVVGLDELQRRLALATSAAERLVSGRTALEARMRAVEQDGKSSAALADRFAQDAQKLKERLDRLTAEIAEVAGEIAEKEDAALAAAESAARTFRSSESAGDAWVRAAAELQREKDPEKTNARLKLIAEDALAGQVGASAAAEARLLAGRILEHRLARLNDQIRAVEQIADATGTAPAKDELQAAVTDTRDKALQALNDAAQGFEKFVGRAPATLKWIPNSSAAVAYYLLSRVDPAQASAHRAKALEALTKALDKQEQSPYLAAQVRLRDHLNALGGN